jgi:hypothetical protein
MGLSFPHVKILQDCTNYQTALKGPPSEAGAILHTIHRPRFQLPKLSKRGQAGEKFILNYKE